MNLARKAVLYFKHEGLKNTLRRSWEKGCGMLARLPVAYREKRALQSFLQELQLRTAGKRVFVLAPCIDWGMPLFQRPHQMAVELAKRENVHVLFVSDQYRYDNFAGLVKIQEGLTLVSRRIVPHMAETLLDAQEIVVIMSWTHQSEILHEIPYDKLIYEYLDDLSLGYYNTQEAIAKHYQLIESADIVTCTAKALYEDTCKHSKRAILLPNACDYGFFHAGRDSRVNPLLAGRLQGYSCVIGYYGSLASWFDYDLIFQVAGERPEWCFVLVGHSFDGTAKRLQQECRENIIHVPAQPYESLPSFIAACDVLCIPFCINKVTQATSPVKLFEYMASGKPILSAMLPECMGYSSVFTYRDAEDFKQKIPLLLDMRYNENYLSLLDKEAQENTWDARVTVILQQLDAQALEQEKKHA